MCAVPNIAKPKLEYGCVNSQLVHRLSVRQRADRVPAAALIVVPFHVDVPRLARVPVPMMATAVAPSEPDTFKTPRLRFVAPVYVLAPVSVQVLML